MRFQTALSNKQLRVLHIYRRETAELGAPESAEQRWRRILDEIIAMIARPSTLSEQEFRMRTDLFFGDLHDVADLGYLDPRERVGFSTYRLTDEGDQLLARWKKANYP